MCFPKIRIQTCKVKILEGNIFRGGAFLGVAFCHPKRPSRVTRLILEATPTACFKVDVRSDYDATDKIVLTQHPSRVTLNQSLRHASGCNRIFIFMAGRDRPLPLPLCISVPLHPETSRAISNIKNLTL